MSDDKRRQVRVPVDLWVEAERDGELYFQRATNLSVGGVYFAQTFPLPVHTKVTLRFALPGEDGQVECEGEVVTTQDLGMGVQFTRLAEGDRARIVALIERHGKAPAPPAR